MQIIEPWAIALYWIGYDLLTSTPIVLSSTTSKMNLLRLALDVGFNICIQQRILNVDTMLKTVKMPTAPF